MSDVQNRTVNQLINDAFKLIKMYSEDRTPPSFRQQEGIEVLNVVIDEFESDSIFIPYAQTLTFPAQAGKREYSIGEESGSDVNFKKPYKLFFAQTIYNDVRFPIKIINENVYYDNISTDVATGRPLYCWLELDNTGATFRCYPSPELTYTFVLRGKFAGENLYNGDILNSKITPSYYMFLAHAVAQYLNSYYGVGIWDAQCDERYKKMLGKFKARNNKDLSMKLDSIMCGRRTSPYPIMNWQY